MSKILSVKDIRLIVYDFDGVMTDNKVVLREDGLESQGKRMKLLIFLMEYPI